MAPKKITKIEPQRLLVFTDLDGTLLDEGDYSYNAASRALQCLRELHIPVIPCTSKTLPEVAVLCRDLNLEHPFIVENGSAICIPDGYFSPVPAYQMEEMGYKILVLGKTWPEVSTFFDALCQEFNLPARSFKDFSFDDIVRLTGLSPEAIEGARRRMFSEPFVVDDPTQITEQVMEYAGKNGFKILRGNRFFHLLGATDKGHAVQRLITLYSERKNISMQTVGLGDSPNDLAMLQAVDFPFQVRKNDGSFAKELHQARPIITSGSGPDGWQEAILQLPGIRCR